MHPFLFSLGPHAVSSYSAALGLALLAGLAWLAWQDRRFQDGRFEAGLWILAVGLLVARIAHVAVNWEYYAERPGDAFSLRAGGFSWHAGLLAGLFALIVLADRSRGEGETSMDRLRHLTGALLVPLSLGLLGGWLGCLLAGCAYGRPVPPPQRFYTPDWPDLYGVLAFRLPSQLLGILLAVALLAGARRLQARPGLFLVILGAGDFLIAFTRGDQLPAWGPLLAIQWADLAVVLLGLVMELASHQRPAVAGIHEGGNHVAERVQM